MEERVTVDDLERVYFRAQNEHGRWVSVNAKEATDAQFDSWAKSRLPVQGEDAPWSPEERADFCDRLWQAGTLHMLKKDVSFEDEEERKD